MGDLSAQKSTTEPMIRWKKIQCFSSSVSFFHYTQFLLLTQAFFLSPQPDNTKTDTFSDLKCDNVFNLVTTKNSG